ncbi:Thymidylate kinase [bioreactor metagenome]|uniref:dTMP kinase n=1 Tax=bioreactor metagenome TaxID=1076179 RepID=A0A644Y821_9ZZZZ
MKKGKFIVLEGLDGSGKSTQTELLLKAIRNKGIDAEFIHFPRTDESSPFYGPMLKRFLKGELGTLSEVDPWFVAMLFAGDRRNEGKNISAMLDEGKWVIADRFVLSNIAFQGAKIANQSEKELLARWILHTEFEVFNLPKPDLTLFIHMPYSFCQKNVLNQRQGADRQYLDGKSDIHEADNTFQNEVYKMYLYMLMQPAFGLTELLIKDSNEVPAPAVIHEMLMKMIEF